MPRQNCHQVSDSGFWKGIMYVILILALFFFVVNHSFAQLYSFYEIREHFFRERPQTGDASIRGNSLGSGLYFIYMQSKEMHITHKILLIR